MTRSGERILLAFGAFILALAVVVAPALSATPAAAAEAGDTIGVSGRPATDGEVDGRTRFSYAADPGQSVSDQFVVANTGSARQDFTVYATDAFNAEDGAFSLLATSEEPAAVGAWVRFGENESRLQFSLEPGQSRLVPFTLALPGDATPGDHVGGIVASVLEPGEQVSIDRRVATAVYARVSGELQPRLAVSNFDAVYHGEWWNPFSGTVTVRYTVENAGNVALAANVTMGVQTWFGIPATESRGGSVPDLLPGNSAAFEFDMAGVGQWLYLNPHVRLNPFVDSNDTSMQLPVPATTRDTVTWAVPWDLIILLVLTAAIVALVWWRRRRDDARGRAWVEYTQQKARAAAERESALAGAAGRTSNDR